MTRENDIMVFSNGIKIDDKIICLNSFYNCITCIDMKRKEIYPIDYLNDESKTKAMLSMDSILCENNKIIFIPYYANNIHIYDFVNKRDEKICIKKDINEKYCKSIYNDGKAYIFPVYGDVIKVLNISDSSVSDLNVNEIIDIKSLKNRVFINSDFYYFEGKYYNAAFKTSTLIVMDFIERKYRTHIVEGAEAGIEAIAGLGSYLYILCSDNKIIKVDLCSMITEKIISIDAKINHISNYYNISKVTNKYIYFFSEDDSSYIKLDYKLSEVFYENVNIFCNEKGVNEEYRLLCKNEDSNLYFISNYCNLLKWDVNNDIKDYMNYEFDITKFITVIKKNEYKNDYVFEKFKNDLRRFINML